MDINTIDAETCAKMFLGGAKNLEANKEWINELNVFPVPDGDTGTNMTLTIMSAAKEVASLESPEMETLCQGNFLRILKRRPRKFRRYPVPASAWFYQGNQET